MNPAAPRLSFWRRRLVSPLRAQLTQGVTPHRLALTIGLGLVCGLFPFLGFTTLLCFLAALLLRLNQPVIHLVNQLLWPVQLALIPLYLRAGAWLFRAESAPFDPSVAAQLFWHSPAQFWARFGLMGLHALTAWLLSSPLLVAAGYFCSRPILRRWASARAARA
ncbi:MAG: DUF2062 domain-containing protein [Opitutae bacterium]|nr:DUF2062 domain-containing protein [Opitutae bacterium]